MKSVGGFWDAAGMPRTAEFDRNALAALLDKQHGVITRRQATACGLRQDAVRYRARVTGPWQVLVPGVYLTHSGHPTQAQQDMAALLYAGPHGVLTGPTALRRFGFTVTVQRRSPALETQHDSRLARGDEVDVLVPTRTQRRDVGFVRLHRTARLPERICVDGEIRFVLAPRAVADTVRGLALPEVRTVIAGAVQRGTCSVSQLAVELAAGPVRYSGPLRQAIAEAGAGIRSGAEADLHDLIAGAKLPEPLYNPRLLVGQAFLASPDCWWPDAGVAVEVDSREWHLSPRDWENTLARHDRMSAEGIIVLHYTPRQLRTDSRHVITTIRSALAAGRPLPHITTLPAS
jgi:hypothetical protein